jgi:pimeloyl-ACP methyl ester carboxylesterase
MTAALTNDPGNTTAAAIVATIDGPGRRIRGPTRTRHGPAHLHLRYGQEDHGPTLLTSGERSPRLFHRVLDELEACLPNRERVEIAASSHTVPSENPAAYDQAVLTFIAKH